MRKSIVLLLSAVAMCVAVWMIAQGGGRNNRILRQPSPAFFENAWQEIVALQKDDLPQSALKELDRLERDATKWGQMEYRMKAVLERFRLHTFMNYERRDSLMADLLHRADAAQALVERAVYRYAVAEAVGRGYGSSQLQLVQLTHLTAAELSELNDLQVNDYPLLVQRDSACLHSGESMADYFLRFRIDMLSDAHRGSGVLTLADTLLLASQQEFVLLPSAQYDSVAPVEGAMVRSFQALMALAGSDRARLLCIDVERLSTMAACFSNQQMDSVRQMCALRLEQLRFAHDHLPEVVEVIAAMNNWHRGDLTPEKEAARVAVLDTYIERYSSYWRINLLKNERASLLAASIGVNGPSQVGVMRGYELVIDAAKLREVTLELFRVENALEMSSLITRVNDAQIKEGLVRLSKKPLLTERVEVPFNHRSTKHVVKMKGLEEGVYVLKIGSSSVSSDVGYHALWVTPYRSIARIGMFGTDVLVADFASGAPAKGVRVNLYTGESGKQKKRLVRTLLTDVNGRVAMPIGTKVDYYSVEVKGSKHTMMSSIRTERLYSRTDGRVKEFLYLDRAAYKPGQMMYYKLIAWNPETRKPEVSRQMTLRLYDAEGKEVEVFQVVTNEFGSATGEIKLPVDRRNGTFRLAAQYIAVHFPVEEYKRPSIVMEMERAVIQNEGVEGEQARYKVKGKVLTSNGVGVQNRVVRYKITNREEEGDESSVVTDAKGEFEVEVTVPEFHSFLYSGGRRRLSVWMRPLLECRVTDAIGETLMQSVLLDPSTNYALTMNLPTKSFVADLPALKVGVERFAASASKVKGTWLVERKRDEAWMKVGTGAWIEDEAVVITPCMGEKEGQYKVSLMVRKAGRDSVMSTHEMILITQQSKKMPVENEFFYYIPTDTVEMGTNIEMWVGSSNRSAQMVVEVFKGMQLVRRDFVRLSDEVKLFSVPYEVEWGANVAMNLTMIGRNGVYFNESVELQGREPSKQLNFVVTGLTRKVMPDQRETWTIKATDAEGHPVKAELMATLYDKTLDQLGYLYWNTNPFGVHRQYIAPLIEATSVRASGWVNQDADVLPVSSERKRTLLNNYMNYVVNGGVLFEETIMPVTTRSAAFGLKGTNMMMKQGSDVVLMESNRKGEPADIAGTLSTLPRTDFRESVFFYGRLLTDAKGEAHISFTVPQALTGYRLRLFAHTTDLKVGYEEAVIEVTKPLMVKVNAPRFAYEGDSLWVKAIVFNQSDSTQLVQVGVDILHTVTMKAGEQREFSFPLVMPSVGDSLRSSYTFTVKALTSEFSDAEQHSIPLMARRQQVSTTYLHNFPSAGAYRFARPFMDAQRGEVRVDYVPSPVYMILDAMPKAWVPESNNFFSWLQAYYIAQASDVMLQRFPTLTAERVQPAVLATLTNGLVALQASDGGFRWFEGMPSSYCLTLTFLDNTARLQTDIGFDLPERIKRAQMEALTFVDGYVAECYRRRKEGAKGMEELVADSEMIRYFAVRGRFRDVPLLEVVRDAHRSMLGALASADLRVSVAEKPQLASALWRYDFKSRALKVAASLQEYTLYSPLTGRYYGNNRGSSVQSLRNVNVHTEAMEALALTGLDGKALQEMAHWLIRQKQGQEWGNALATVNALNALLCYGVDEATVGQDPTRLFDMNVALLPSVGQLANDKEWNKCSATFTSEQWMGLPKQLEVKKRNDEYTWLTATWSRLAPIEEVEPSKGDLQVRQTVLQNGVQTLRLIEGDAIVRLTVSTTRDLDFVVLHSPVAGCFEPMSYRSGYEVQGASPLLRSQAATLWYYREVKDNGMNLYIQHLPRGEYTIDVPYYVARSGMFSQGVPTAESVYSSDFKAVDASRLFRVGGVNQ